MGIQQYIRIVRANWLLILLLVVVSTAAAAAYSVTRTPVYTARSAVAVAVQSAGTVTELQQGSTYTEGRVATWVELASAPLVLDPVIDELGLETTSDALAADIEISSPLNTTLIDIAVSDTDPERAAAVADAIGDSLVTVLPEVETVPGRDGAAILVTPVRAATVPTVPVSPEVPLMVVLGVLAGLILGLGAAVVRQLVDTRIRTVRDVVALTDRPVLGIIPFDAKAAARPLVLSDDPADPRSEATRMLRTNLRFLETGGKQALVVTSARPGEGKTTLAANLALAMAAAGKRVVLVDADLRRPRVAAHFGLEGGVGLSDVLIGRVDAADAMQEWGDGGLRVLCSGRTPPNPSELLGSAAFQRLVDELRRSADAVVFDSPPLLAVTDAAVVASRLDGAVVAAAAGRVRRQEFQAAITALETARVGIAGVVVTMVPARAADVYAYTYDGKPSRLEPAAAVAAPRPVRHRGAPEVSITRTSTSGGWTARVK